jgi:hypothetical protein
VNKEYETRGDQRKNKKDEQKDEKMRRRHEGGASK